MLIRAKRPTESTATSAPQPATEVLRAENTDNQRMKQQRRQIRDYLYDQIDPLKVAAMSRDALRAEIESMIRQVCDQQRLQLSASEEASLALDMVDEMLGIGPIQPLLADDSINDILVNGANQVYVERYGKLELSSVTFVDEEHVFNTAQRIAAGVGRRIDEANPMADARLADGSRVNIISHPLALDGTSISIRKFMRRNMNLDSLVSRQAISEDMKVLMQRAMTARLNVVVSGGTGAGKTTLLNALSQDISYHERVVTIEDACRAAITAATCRASGNAAGQRRRHRQGGPARFGAQLPAHAPGSHHSRRGARR